VTELTKYLLAESDIPTHWVNLASDLPGTPAPPLHPATKEPLRPQDLAPIFPMGLIEQEVSADPEIEIPDEVREIYKLWRPTPLHRARRLERARHAGPRWSTCPRRRRSPDRFQFQLSLRARPGPPRDQPTLSRSRAVVEGCGRYRQAARRGDRAA
jgi:hypothetical protein